MRNRAVRALVIVVLTGATFAVDFVTGLVPDVSGLYLVPVVLAAYWFGLVPGLLAAAAILSADLLAHPGVELGTVFFHNITHLITYSFAAGVTAIMRRQLQQIRSLQDRRDYELALARRVHDSMAEKLVVSSDRRFNIAARSVPARELGGDHVLVRDTEQGLFACIADISGKGISAAMFLALLDSHLRDAIDRSPLPHEVVQYVNKRLHVSFPPEVFVTMFSCLVSSGEMTYVNAGHEPTFLLDANGEMRTLLTAEGLPLGVQSELSVEEQHCAFGVGSRLLCYSDGLTGAPRFKEGGYDEIGRMFRSVSAGSAEEVADAMLRAAAATPSDHLDDTSILVIRRRAADEFADAST